MHSHQTRISSYLKRLKPATINVSTFLGTDGLITIEDAVIASRGVGQNVEIKQTQSVTGKYTLRGSGIGLLAGFLLGGPIGGLIGGTAVGAISGALKDIGIDDKFIREASEMLEDAEGVQNANKAIYILQSL